MLAQATHTPELELTEDEAKEFLTQAQRVARHYSVETSQKTLDWITFIGAGAAMYGSRAIAIRNRHRDERRAAQERHGRRVVPLRPNGAAGAAQAAPAPSGGPVPIGGADLSQVNLTGYEPNPEVEGDEA